MSIAQLPDALRFGQEPDPVRIEFDRRIGHMTMPTDHYHPAYELYYLFSGERGYFIKDRTYPVKPGDLVLIGSNEVHKTIDMGIPNHERIVIYYEPAFFDPYTQEEKRLLHSAFSMNSPVLCLNHQEQRHAEALLASLLNELAEKPPGYGMHIRHMASELLLFAARYPLKHDTVPAPKLSPVQQKISDIVRHINTHYMEALDLDGLSRRFFISRSHLSRVFKEETGFHFTEYVNLTRVKEAERLLRETDWSITRISECAGFDNFSHFGKVFKKLTGRSPRACRTLSGENGLW